MPNDYGIQKISPSALTTYENCPRAFYYSVILGLQLPQTKIHFEFGTAIHEAIDIMYQGRVNGKWEDKKAGHAALEAFAKRFDYNLLDDVNIKDYNDAVEDGKLILSAYWDEKEVLLAQGVNPIQFEIPGKTILHNPETNEPLPIPVSYRLDGIGEKNTVIEFKTSSTLYDVFEVRDRIQSMMYVWIYYQLYNVIPTLHYVIMLKKKKKSVDRIQHLPLVYEMSDIMAFDARVRALLEKIKNKEFNKPIRGHKPYCDCKKFEEALTIN